MARGHQEQWEEAEHTPEAAQCACGITWTQDISLSGQPPSHSGKWSWLLLMKITAAKCARLVLWRKPVAVSRVTNRGGLWRKWPGSLLWIYSVNHCSWFPGRDRQVPVPESRVSHGQCSGCPWCSVLWSVPGQLQMARERLARETFLLSCSGSSVHKFPRSQTPHRDEI